MVKLSSHSRFSIFTSVNHSHQHHQALLAFLLKISLETRENDHVHVSTLKNTQPDRGPNFRLQNSKKLLKASGPIGARVINVNIATINKIVTILVHRDGRLRQDHGIILRLRKDLDQYLYLSNE